MSDDTTTFTVPEAALIEQLGVSTDTFKKHRAAFAHGTDWGRVRRMVLWTESAAEKLREAVLGEKTATPLPENAPAAEAVLTVAYVPGNRRPRIFCVGAGGNVKDRTCWVPVAVPGARVDLFMRGMTLRASKVDSGAVWRFLGAPGEVRLRYPRRKGVW